MLTFSNPGLFVAKFDGLRLINLCPPCDAISNIKLSVRKVDHIEDSGRKMTTSVEDRECMPSKPTAFSIDAKMAITFISIEVW
jgi:hypothetical protein